MQMLRFKWQSINLGGGGLINTRDALLARTLLTWFHARAAGMGIKQKQERGVSIACGL